MLHEAAHESVDTILMLPAGTTGASLAALCRGAALEFVNDSTHWGKAELATWLQASYAPIIKHARKDQEDSSVWPVPLLREIDDRLVARMMESARAEVIAALDRTTSDGSAVFVLRALIAGAVIRCEDGASALTWIPTGNATRLADRVLSLFAVDYLARPGDYETELAVCRACETAEFSTRARRCPTCATRQSLLAPRRCLTLPYPPLGA